MIGDPNPTLTGFGFSLFPAPIFFYTADSPSRPRPTKEIRRRGTDCSPSVVPGKVPPRSHHLELGSSPPLSCCLAMNFCGEGRGDGAAGISRDHPLKPGQAQEYPGQSRLLPLSRWDLSQKTPNLAPSVASTREAPEGNVAESQGSGFPTIWARNKNIPYSQRAAYSQTPRSVNSARPNPRIWGDIPVFPGGTSMFCRCREVLQWLIMEGSSA